MSDLPEEAVQAATRAAHQRLASAKGWGKSPEAVIRAALEAALPHLTEAAWVKGNVAGLKTSEAMRKGLCIKIEELRGEIARLRDGILRHHEVGEACDRYDDKALAQLDRGGADIALWALLEANDE